MNFNLKIKYIIFLILFITGFSYGQNKTAVQASQTTILGASTFTNPVIKGGDPYVHQEGKKYYYLQTTGNSVRIWQTENMANLSSATSKVVFTPNAGAANSKNVWAPEMYRFDGKWYIYYTAGDGQDINQRTWVIENSNPDPMQGEWIDKGKISHPNANFWAIDGTVMEYQNKRYFLWSGRPDAATGGLTQKIYIAEMSNPWTLKGNLTLLSEPNYSWEKNGFGVNEGPEILKGSKNGYFMVYSASYCGTDNYALGMLTLTQNGDPLKKTDWTKVTEPVFTQKATSKAYGPGHNSFFKSPDGKEDWIIYHANLLSNQGCGGNRYIRMQKFTYDTNGVPIFGQPVPVDTAMDGPSTTLTTEILESKTYNFEADNVGSVPANISAVNGNITVDGDAGRTNTITPVTSPVGLPATFNMDLFQTAKDYSVTWKETYTTAGTTCFTLRGFGKFIGGDGKSNQYQGYLFQVNAVTNALTIIRLDAGGSATIKNAPLTAPGTNVARWYRATVDGALLTFEYSDDNVNFTSAISTIEDVYPSGGLTQLTRGYGAPIAGTYIDDVVFTPITTTSVVYDFESDTANSTPANITAANGTVNTDSDKNRTKTMNIMTATNGNTASLNLNLIPSASNYAVIWKENFITTSGRSGMILRANGANTVNPGMKQGYLFQVSASQAKMRIYSVTNNTFTVLKESALAARSVGLNRWYRAVANGNDLSFESSDNGRDFTVICTVTDNTYSAGSTQFVQGFGTDLGNLFVDNIVFTPFGSGSLSVKKSEQNDFTLYPNPAKDIVNLLFNSNNIGNSTITIYDIQGRVVKNIKTKLESNTSIDVSSLKRGIYFLKIKSNSSEKTEKLIIN